MARIARVMVPGVPYHVTHRGNKKQVIFREKEDFRFYLGWLEEYSGRFSMKIWGYCLMPNHVHLLVVGEGEESLAKAIGNTHRCFARRVNLIEDVTGHAWANRFASSAMDERHLWAAIRYVELNPVRGGLACDPCSYPWSSAAAHASLRDDSLLDAERPFPGPIGDWGRWLATGLSDVELALIRLNTSTGRPTGSQFFVESIEEKVSRRLTPRKRGPMPGRKSR